MAAPGRDENLFQLLVESAVDYAIFILDPTGHVATWNPGAERIKGYRAEEIVGKHFSVFYPRVDVEAGKCEHELVVAAAEGRFEDEGLRIRKDGSSFLANVIITALRDSTGKLLGFAKVTRDLTESTARVEAERALASLARLQELVVLLAGAVTAEQVIDIVVQRGAEALGATAAGFFRPRGDELELVATAGVPADMAKRYARISAKMKIPGVVAATTGISEWAASAALYTERYPDAVALGATAGATCSLPLKVASRVIGAVNFRFAIPRIFSGAERTFIETFAEQAAQALVRAEAQRRLEALSDLAQALSNATTTAEVARIIVERTLATTGADTCTLHRHDETVPALILLDERGTNADVLEHIQVFTRVPENPSWRVVDSQVGLWVETAEEYGRLYPSLKRVTTNAPRTRSFWAMPLLTEGRAIALLGVGFREERAFHPEERQYVETFTRHCGDALLRASRLEDERQARAWLATTLRSIGDAVIATDRMGQVTMMNPIAEKLTGWLEGEARGRPLREVFVIVNEHTREPVVSPVDKVLELGTIVGLANHAVLIGRDGKTETPIDDSGAPIRGDDGAIEGVVLVFRDVTEKKRDEGRRRLLEDAGAALAESLDYDVTLRKVAQLAVPGFAEWCGVDILEEGTSGTRQVAVAHEDPAKVIWAIELGKRYPPPKDAPTGVPNVLRTGKSEIYPELTDEMIRRGAQDEEHARIMLELKLRSVLIVPLRAHGRTLGVISFIRGDGAPRYDEADLAFAEEVAARCANGIDNARLYDAEQQARSAADETNRAKDEFLAMVSHELRTPLNAIMGWAKMLSSGSLDDEKRGRAVSTIDRNAVAMAQLIEDLLDISRIISGKMRLEVQTTNLARVIEAAIDAVRPAAEAKQLHFVERIDADAQSVQADPARLQQIVWNLLSNAVKFTPREGKIEVEVVRDRGGVEIAVIDSGRGIDPRFLPYVFDAFRQEDASHTRSRGGLGLGLAITRQLVELHGGSITAASEGEGRGATFRVFLPAGVAPMSTQRTGRVRKFRLDSALERLPKLEGVHALVVDDEEDARELLKTILEELGARVTVADGVAEALAALEREVPTLLISDIGMPGQDGYDLIRELRKLPPERGGAIPAAALTAYARAEDRRRTLDAGFTMHLSKPLDPSELIAVVASLTQSG